MKFWKWNNARLVINIDNINIIIVDSEDDNLFNVFCNESTQSNLTLDKEEYQSLMNFITMNDK